MYRGIGQSAKPQLLPYSHDTRFMTIFEILPFRPQLRDALEADLELRTDWDVQCHLQPVFHPLGTRPRLAQAMGGFDAEQSTQTFPDGVQHPRGEYRHPGRTLVAGCPALRRQVVKWA